MFGYSMWGNYPAVAIPLVALGTQSGIIDVIHVSANVVSAGFFIHNGVVRGLRWLETQGWYPFSPTHKYEASVGSEKNGGYRNKLVVTCLHSGLNRTFLVLSFPEGGLRAPNLKQFSIRDCKKLKSLPEQMHTQLPSLEDLVIERCPEIQCFPEEGLPSSLKTLHISNCQKLMISQTIWDLQRLSSLTTMAIVRFDNNVFPDEVLLPSNLKNLKITAFPNFESLNHYHMSSLQSLSDYSCLNLESLNGLPYLSSLQYLRIKNCLNLKSLSGLQYLPSLQSLVISYCPNLESLMVFNI